MEFIGSLCFIYHIPYSIYLMNYTASSIVWLLGSLASCGLWGPDMTGISRNGGSPTFNDMPGQPVAYNYGLLWLIYGLLYGIVACYFRLLGVPGGDFPYLQLAKPSFL